ncbi:MAG: SLC13 family permease [Bacteroidota bacterium]
MTLEIFLVFVIILTAIVLFITEWVSIDTVAFGIMVVLLVTGLVTPQQGIMGFANQATVTILALMFIGVGLEQSGAIGMLGQKLKPILGQKEWLTVLLLMVIVASVSAVISTTAVVIVFLRILVDLSDRLKTSISKLLIPLSFAGILGGSCSLMGTSTNLIVNSIAKDFGLEAFGLFEFSNIGALFFVAALAYMVLIGRRLLPGRKTSDNFSGDYLKDVFLTSVVILPDSPLVGKSVKATIFGDKNEFNLLEIKHANGVKRFPKEEEVFRAGDTLLLKTSLKAITGIFEKEGLEFVSRENVQDQRLNNEETVLCEAVIRPNSRLIGDQLEYLDLKKDYAAIPLAIQQGKRKSKLRYKKNATKIKVGDVVLLQVSRAEFPRLYQSSDWIILQEEGQLLPSTNKKKLALALLSSVVILAACGILPIMISALTGAFAMIITGCIDLQRAYRKIDWSIIFLLAGMIPLGSAMSNTGADTYLANQFVEILDNGQPRMYVAALFGFTVLMSGFVSNNATAILVTPIAIAIAAKLGVPPKGFLLTVMFAANMSFFTPIGYQTNTLIFSPGNYKFRDFLIVGGILTLLIWLLATVFIPMFYF